MSMNNGMDLTVRGAIARELAPARLLVQADAERGLAHDLVRQQRVGGMEAARADVTVYPLELVALEHARAAGARQRQVDDLLGAFDAVVRRSDDLHRPRGPVIDAVRPVLGDALQVRQHRLELELHLRKTGAASRGGRPSNATPPGQCACVPK